MDSTQSAPINVVIVDNNQIMCIGLEAILSKEEGISVVGKFGTLVGVLEFFETAAADVVLMDFTAYGFELESIPAITKAAPGIHIVAITPDQEGQTIVNALKAGVTSYVKKDCDLQEIISSVRETANGTSFFCGTILDSIHRANLDPNADEIKNFNCEPVLLSQREQEVIALIAEGLTNTEIADRLFLSHHTVNTHRKNIMQKLQVKNTAAIVMYAVKSNLVNVNKFLFSR